VRINYGTAWNPLQQDDCPTVEVDLCQGMAITVLGNCMLSVEAVYGPLLFGAPGATQPPLEISLSIAYGVNAQNARRTVKYGDIPEMATTVQRPIPLQARSGYLVNTDAPNVPALRADQLLADVAGAAIVSSDIMGKKDDMTVRVADGARAATLSTGAFPSPRTAIIWTLNL
jgi:hypothetical protein